MSPHITFKLQILFKKKKRNTSKKQTLHLESSYTSVLPRRKTQDTWQPWKCALGILCLLFYNTWRGLLFFFPLRLLLLMLLCMAHIEWLFNVILTPVGNAWQRIHLLQPFLGVSISLLNFLLVFADPITTSLYNRETKLIEVVTTMAVLFWGFLLWFILGFVLSSSVLERRIKGLRACKSWKRNLREPLRAHPLTQIQKAPCYFSLFLYL